MNLEPARGQRTSTWPAWLRNTQCNWPPWMKASDTKPFSSFLREFEAFTFFSQVGLIGCPQNGWTRR